MDYYYDNEHNLIFNGGEKLGEVLASREKSDKFKSELLKVILGEDWQYKTGLTIDQAREIGSYDKLDAIYNGVPRELATVYTQEQLKAYLAGIRNGLSREEAQSLVAKGFEIFQVQGIAIGLSEEQVRQEWFSEGHVFEAFIAIPYHVYENIPPEKKFDESGSLVSISYFKLHKAVDEYLDCCLKQADKISNEEFLARYGVDPEKMEGQNKLWREWLYILAAMITYGIHYDKLKDIDAWEIFRVVKADPQALDLMTGRPLASAGAGVASGVVGGIISGIAAAEAASSVSAPSPAEG